MVFTNMTWKSPQNLFKRRLSTWLPVCELKLNAANMSVDIRGCCCFFDEKSNEPVPLKSIQVFARVCGFLVNVESTLLYENEGDKSIEAIFNFPVDENSSAYKFEAEIDGRVIVAECQEKEQAKETYDKAIEQGYTAAYMAENESTSDIFCCKVGNLLPKKKANIKFAYISELVFQEDGTLKFVLPTLLNPRYNPSVDKGGAQDLPTKKYVKGCDQPYKFEINAVVSGLGEILNVKSEKDKLNVVYEEERKQAVVNLSGSFVADHDFELEIFAVDVHSPKVLIEKGVETADGILKQDVIMLNFFPKLRDTDIISNHEFIFVIDRSGSMDGSRIKDARDSLLLFLKSLPPGCYFNIIGFGSSYEVLFKEESLLYSEESLKKALAHQENLQADLGGTEILEPLDYIYKKSLLPSHSRQIILLTDGEVSNTSMVIRLVQSHSHDTRVFTLGIGEGASSSLMKGVARAGRGKAEFVKSGEKMRPVVMRLLKFAMQSSVTDVSLEWKLGGSPKVTQIPSKLPPIFNGDRLIAYGIINESSVIDGRVVLKGKIGGEEIEFPLEIDGNRDTQNSEGCLPVHRMIAKSLIKELQDSDNEKKDNKAAIIALSLASNVISLYTAMVGIDKAGEKIIQVDIVSSVVPNIRDLSLGCGMKFPMMMQRRCAPSSNKLKSSRCLGVGGTSMPTECCKAKSSSSSFSLFQKMKSTVVKAFDKSVPRLPSRFPLPDCAPVSSDEDNNRCCKYECDDDGRDPPKPNFKTPQQDTVLNLVSFYEFSGHWKLSEHLVSLISLTLEDVKSSSPVKDQDVWITAVILSYLTNKCADEKEEWEMIEIKALQWLKGQNLEGHSIDDLLKKAKLILK